LSHEPFQLTPGFSPVWWVEKEKSGFNRFEKPLKRLDTHANKNTWLKSGANER
jgi:hypothetical protein